MVPNNVRKWADHLSDTVDIRDHVIYFGPGTSDELLMRIPLSWKIGPRSTIVITLGIDNEYSNPMLRVGVTDNIASNYFYITDKNDYHTWPPCFPEAGNREDRVLPCAEIPSIFKFTLLLEDKYGYCETAQNGGYFNGAEYSKHLDANRDLFLQLLRLNYDYTYYIRYITITTDDYP